MKASEMANEQITDAIESSFCASSSPFGAMMREAAKRLCVFSTLTTHTDNSEVIAELQRRLKVAEDALGESRVAVCHICDQKHMCGHGTAKFDPCCIYKDIDSALAAIRGEGVAK